MMRNSCGAALSSRLSGLAIRLLVVAWILAASGHAARAELAEVWLVAQAGQGGQPVSFQSSSPFSLRDVGAPGVPATQARATLFLPEQSAGPVPAVVMLHGASGVLSNREMTYGPQYAAMGVAALVIDVFGARRDSARGFAQRLIRITEAMSLADAFAGLRYLEERPEVDATRVALVGFSYGGMATTYAAHEMVSARYAPDGARFAAHVAYYAPCIATFVDARATGAPILFVSGGRDAIVDPERCVEVDAALQAGGAQVERISYPDGLHQWDGFFRGPRPIGRNLAPCRFQVEEDGAVTDLRTGLPMATPWLRIATLALCVGREGYLIGRDDDVRAQSNRDVARFLSPVLFPPRQGAASSGP